MRKLSSNKFLLVIESSPNRQQHNREKAHTHAVHHFHHVLCVVKQRDYENEMRIAFLTI